MIIYPKFETTDPPLTGEEEYDLDIFRQHICYNIIALYVIENKNHIRSGAGSEKSKNRKIALRNAFSAETMATAVSIIDRENLHEKRETRYAVITTNVIRLVTRFGGLRRFASVGERSKRAKRTTRDRTQD